MDYIVIQSATVKSLVAEVNKAIKEGYKPIGGIMAEYTGYINSPKYFQSMVKDK